VKRLVGILGWLGVVLVLGALVLRFVRPELQAWSQRLAIAGLAVTALYALTQWRDIARSWQHRNVRYGSIAAGSIVLFLAILVAVNWISSRQNRRWDLTEAQQFSLSDQTRQILAGLERPVSVRVYYDSAATTADQYRDRLDEYAYLSDQLSVDYVDAIREPLRAEQDSIQALPTVVLSYDGRTERTSDIQEQGITNALKKVIEGQAKRIYVVQGHGEHDTASSEPGGYNGAAQALQGDNFEVAPLTLAQTGTVPEDATLLIVAGPAVDYLPGELDAIRAYLRRGGKLMLMIDPPSTAGAGQPTSLIALAREWGVEVGTNIVVDASGIGQLLGTGPETPIAMPVAHAITEGFRVITAFPLTRSAAPIEGGVDGRTAQRVLESSPQSWAETNLKGLFETGQPDRNPDQGDLNGPVSIAAAVSAAAPEAPAPAEPDAPKPETRVLVVGDSDFASNRAINIGGNRDLFLNMANWLAQQEDLIAIRPRDPSARSITLTADQSQRIFWATIFIIPILLFANAVRVWWRRR
jgi:ABC-type uncharacterized transport system involved in gliding motility auxiliary subunit